MPSHAALAHLESLLRARKLDVTLTTSALWQQARRRVAPRPACRRSMRRSAAGLPRGQLSEIVGAALGRPDDGAVPCAGRRSRHAAKLSRCRSVRSIRSGIGVRDSGSISGDCCGSAAPVMRRCAATALKAMNLVLQAGNFGLVAFDLADVPRAGAARVSVHDLAAHGARDRRQPDGGAAASARSISRAVLAASRIALDRPARSRARRLARRARIAPAS